MWCLMKREWRENRALLLGFLLLAPLLSIGLKGLLVTWEKTTPADSMAWFVPPMLLLFVLGMAADLVAADAASGRSAFFAALPVRAGTIWASKAVFLLAATVFYLAWLLAVEAAILSVAGLDAGALFAGRRAEQGILLLVPALLAGAGTLFFSTLLDRGLAAAVAALATLGMIGLGVYALDPVRLRMGPTALTAGVVLLFLAFLAGSFVAFTKGRIHLGARLPRVVFASATFLLVTLLPAGWYGAALAAYRDLKPTDPVLAATLLDVDPAGKTARFAVRRRDRGPLGARSPSLTVTVDLATGDVTPPAPFEPAAATWPFLKVGDLTLTWKRSGKCRIARPDGAAIELDRNWFFWGGHADWGVLVRGPKNRMEIRRFDGGAPIPLPGRRFFSVLLLPPDPSGSALGVTGRGLVRIPLGGAPIEVGSPVLGASATRDGKYGLAVLADGVRALRAEDAAVMRVAGPEIRTPVRQIAWAAEDRHFLIVTEGAVYAGDVRHPERGLEDWHLPPGLGYPEWSDGCRVLFRSREGVIVLAEKDRHRQLLPRKEER